MVKTKTNNDEPEMTMDQLVAEVGDSIIPFKQGEVTEANVTAVTKGCVWVDVAGVAVGIIPEREFSYGTLDLKPGDVITAYVLSLEDKEGHVVLSLRKADKEKLWITLKDKFDTGETIQAKAVEANKGGLMVEVGGVVGFLPISQLASQHYPRSAGGNRDEIASKINSLVGETLNVKIISFDKITNKLIFSERAAGDTEVEEKLSKIEVGQEMKGKITGIVDFGLFVSIGDDLEGLVHISEISWKRVSDLRTMYNVGDEIDVAVTGISDGKVSLSVKRLMQDPWVEAVKKYEVGNVVEGVVTGITRFGAFVRLDDTIDGLVHKSELSDQWVDDPSEILTVGQKETFKVISIDNSAHRLSLTLKGIKSENKSGADKSKVAEEIMTKGDKNEVEEVVVEKKPKKVKAVTKAVKKSADEKKKESE
jgi:small subunit ribosomal protein S1